MKDEYKIIKLVTFVLLITILALVSVCSIYAKYTTGTNGSAIATVAKWSIKVDGQDITKTDTITFNLLSTITNTDGTAEKNVKDTAGKLIAPGTMGKFKIDVENDSDVMANCTVVYSINNTKIPLEFSTTQKEGSWTQNLSDLNTEENTNINAGDTKSMQIIYWRWPFNGNDTVDSDLISNQLSQNVKVTAQQVDINK